MKLSGPQSEVFRFLSGRKGRRAYLAEIVRGTSLQEDPARRACRGLVKLGLAEVQLPRPDEAVLARYYVLTAEGAAVLSDGRDDDDLTNLQFDHVVAELLRNRLSHLEVSILKTAEPDPDDVVEYRALRRLYQEALRLFHPGEDL